MAQYKKFIPENTAVLDSRRIGIYNSEGNRVGFIPLGHLTPPNSGKKLYSFGALSDVHVQYDTAQADFQKALTYLNDTEDVEFTCICGDLTVNGTDTELLTYKGYVNSYSPNTPVYAVFGNHDTYQGLYNDTQKYTGQPLNYTFTHGSDVFIMVGNISGYSGAIGTLFTQATLQWLYEQLEANRNKRCFLFQHILSSKGSGDCYKVYSHTKLSGEEAMVFESLISHYSNVIWFHGHSHMKFNLQNGANMANYDKVFGCHSVHIPSLAVPRDVIGSNYTDLYADSEGYVVDVYENGIHLRGRDFVKGEFLPIASYWIDTTLQTVPERTYKDSTGTVNIGEDVTITLNEGYQVSSNVNDSYGNLISASNYITSDIIPLEEGYKYIVYGTDVNWLSCNPHWYNVNNGFMGSQSGTDGYGWTVNARGDVSWVVTPPKGAAGVRLQCYAADTSASMSKITVKRVPDATEVRDLCAFDWYEGMMLNRLTGDVWDLGTAFCASDYITISGKSYTLNTVTTAYLGCSILYFDSNKKLLAFDKNAISRYEPDILTYRLPTRENAAYIRIEAYTSPVDGEFVHWDKCKLLYLTEND